MVLSSHFAADRRQKEVLSPFILWGVDPGGKKGDLSFSPFPIPAPPPPPNLLFSVTLGVGLEVRFGNRTCLQRQLEERGWVWKRVARPRGAAAAASTTNKALKSRLLLMGETHETASSMDGRRTVVLPFGKNTGSLLGVDETTHWVNGIPLCFSPPLQPLPILQSSGGSNKRTPLSHFQRLQEEGGTRK